MSRVSRALDGIEVIFDHENAVDPAGLLLIATLAERLGLEAAADELIRGQPSRSSVIALGGVGGGVAVRNVLVAGSSGGAGSENHWCDLGRQFHAT